MAPAFSVFQVNHAYFVVNLRRFAPLKFLPSKPQQLFRVLDVFEHDEVEPMNGSPSEAPNGQGFRVPHPFLAKGFVRWVPILDFPFDVSKGNPTPESAGILLLLPAAIPIQGSSQRGDVLLPLQHP